MKKIFLFLALFAASAMIMTSCGGSETTQPAEGEATEVNEGEATEVNEGEATEATEENTEATEEATTDDAEAAVLGDATHGADVYTQACLACHGAGIAGAAKLDDKARWEATASAGLTTVYDHAINGFTGDNGMMPPKGGRADLSDQDVYDAVAYMFEQAGVEVK